MPQASKAIGRPIEYRDYRPSFGFGGASVMISYWKYEKSIRNPLALLLMRLMRPMLPILLKLMIIIMILKLSLHFKGGGFSTLKTVQFQFTWDIKWQVYAANSNQRLGAAGQFQINSPCSPRAGEKRKVGFKLFRVSSTCSAVSQSVSSDWSFPVGRL